MRAPQFKRIALVFAVQLILILTVDTWGRKPWGLPERVCFFGAYVLPFVGYIAFLYGAPMCATMSSIPKMACLTLLSFVMTMGGTMVILVLWFLLSAVTGVPLR